MEALFFIAKNDGKEINPVIEAYEEIIKTYTHSEVGIEANIRIGILQLYYNNNESEAEKYFKTYNGNLFYFKVCLTCIY